MLVLIQITEEMEYSLYTQEKKNKDIVTAMLNANSRRLPTDTADYLLHYCGAGGRD